MKPSLHPTALYRIPCFPLNATLKQSWGQLKAAIAHSSTEFHQQIKDITKDELDQLPPAIANTIWKYFNRAKYRCTPYADFAGVGLCEIKNRPEHPVLRIKNEPYLHVFTDWPHKDEISIISEKIVELDLLLFANSSYYPIPGGIRYISHFDGAFQLSDLDHNDLAMQVLKHCAKPIQYSILDQTLKAKGIITGPIADFINELLEMQLLFSSHHPNIIGEDYFKRINIRPEQFPGKYLLSERKATSGTLPVSIFKDLPEAIHILQYLIPFTENTNLSQFISRFSQKFEGQQIPLMAALDPETGIGYGDLEQEGSTDSPASKFAAKKNQSNDPSQDQFKQLILQQFLGSMPKNNVLHLENIPNDASSTPLPLPNSFAAFLTLADELITVDSIGGYTANTLAGRFSLLGDQYTDHCRRIAELEQQANPEVLFFDVAYLAEGKVDNVNRRHSIYPLQLSILNYDTSKDPLLLNDILAYIQGGQLMLRSKKLNKRLIPRFSTAYNYTRSDLSVFRLLCDLQHQGIQSNLSINLQNILPDAAYYPRIQYKNIILSPAKWKCSSQDFKNQEDHKNEVNALRAYLANIGVSEIFKAGNGDQTLYYDQRAAKDLAAFLIILQKEKKLYAEEAFLPQNSPVKDENNNPYQCQLLVSFTHQQEIYKDYPLPGINQPKTGVKRIISPGNNWLYFEIYTHVHRSDELLLGPISYFLNQQHDDIEKWFFIRYNENGDHIRLRVQLKDSAKGHQLTSALTEILEEEIESGIVSELLLKTYKREVHRYGWATMEAVESHFSADSNYIVSLLESAPSDHDKYKLCLELLNDIYEREALTEKEFKYITGKVSNSFDVEHNLAAPDFRELNRLYKEISLHHTPELLAETQQLKQDFLNSFISTLALFPEMEKRSILSSLIHMHVNRLFSSDQRTHEMIIYYMLIKEMQRQEAKHKAVMQE